MKLELTNEQAQELGAVLEMTLGDLSHEIAATDNPGFREQLSRRRDRLAEVSEGLVHLGVVVPSQQAPSG